MENVIQEVDVTLNLRVKVIGDVDASVEALIDGLTQFNNGGWTCIGCGPRGTYGYEVLKAEQR